MAIEGVFYAEALGRKLQTDEPFVAGFWLGSGCLVAGPDTAAGIEARPAGGVPVAVRVSDREAEHALLTRRGVDVSPLQARPWGEGNFSLTDPDGYRWEYGQPQ